MGLELGQLVFDPTATSEGANVGAFLRDSAGNLITSTLVSGHQAIDANIVNTVSVTSALDVYPATQAITAQDVGSTTTVGANGQSIVTGSATAGSTASFTFNTKTALRVQASGTWTGTLQSEISIDGGTTWYPSNIYQNATSFTGSSWTANFEGSTNVAASTQWRLRATAAWTGTATILIVESTNQAIVNLGNPLPSGTNTIGAVNQGGTWTVQQGTPPWSVVGNIADGTADSGDPVKTGTKASFGAALSAQGATGERSDMISDRYRRLFVSGSADVAAKNTAVTATTSAASLLGSQLQGRRKIYIQNNSTKFSIYLGHDNTVTSSNGLKVGAGAVFEDEIGEDVAVWVIGDNASIDVRVYELA